MKKNFIIIIALFIIGNLFVINHFFNTYKIKLEKETNIELKKIFEVNNNEFRNFLNNLDRKIDSIIENKNFIKFLETNENIEISNELFLTIIKETPNIFQLRFINSTGFEVIRAETVENKSFLVNKEKLQDKSSRYYFKDIMNIKENTFWYSKLDLNVEHNKVEIPYRPVLRVGKVIKIDKEIVGILILNIDMKEFLNKLIKEDNYYKYIIDKDGYILVNNNNLDNWQKYSANLDLKFHKEIFTNAFYSKLDFSNGENLQLVIKPKPDYINEILWEREKNFLFILLIVDFLSLLIVLSLLLNKYLKKRVDQAINNERKLNDTVNAYVAMTKTDLKGDITFVTEEFENITGYKKEELIGKNHRVIKSDDVPYHIFKKLWSTITQKKIFTGMFPIIAKNGQKKYFDVKIYPDYDLDGKHIGYIALRRNITEEIILRDLNEILKNEVELKTQELEKTNQYLLNEKNKLVKAVDLANFEKEKSRAAEEEAKTAEEEAVASQEELLIIQEQLLEANQAKSEFLANMSHEIRTPITGIIGITDIMLEEDCSKSQKEYLTIIKNSSASLKNIINDILDFSKIQSGKFQIVQREFDLNEVLNDVMHLFTPQINSKKLEFNIKIDENIENYLIGDSLRLTQVLTNLIGNSVKFTNEGKIELRISILNKFQDNIKIKFTVEDTGIGINEKTQNTIFESFTQGELSNTKNYKGTGLGLAISKSLVELMKGNISFESHEGVGTKFFFTLDFKFLDKNDIKKKDKELLTLSIPDNLKALVAEDSEVNQIVIKKALNNIGFEVYIANDGEEAVDLVKKEKFDIIFMDIQMPNMDGYEATHKIRLYDINIPIIAVSAAVMPEDIDKSLQSGMNAHIKKPIEKDELFEVIKRTLANKNIVVKKIKEKDSDFIEEDDFEISLRYLKKDFYKEEICTLLSLFKKQYGNFEEDIKTFDNNLFKKYIHKLKGSSGNLSFTNIYNLCDDIEKINKKDVSKLIEDLVSQMQKLMNNINTYLGVK